jgi:two-component system sensor histidine kinase KdpD
MATAVAFGRGPAVFASIAALLVFDRFFVEPLHQFTVSDPEEWVSLLFFLLTSEGTVVLCHGARRRLSLRHRTRRRARGYALSR